MIYATLRLTWGHFGITLASLWGHLGSMRVALGHFWVTLAPHWAYDAYMCGPGGAENRKHARHYREKQIFEGVKGGASRNDGFRSGGLGPNPGSLWGHFAHFGVTLGSLRLYEGYFGIILVRFQKTLILPIDFDDFMQL